MLGIHRYSICNQLYTPEIKTSFEALISKKLLSSSFEAPASRFKGKTKSNMSQCRCTSSSIKIIEALIP